MRRWLAGLALCGAAWGLPPVIREMSPRGAQAGASVKLTLRGEELAAGMELETTLPARISRLRPAEAERPGSELPFLVEVSKDAAPGLYPVRVSGPDGISNVALFAVSGLAEQAETESEDPKKGNGTRGEAQAFAVPGVMNGTLAAADVDFYSFAAKAGERIVFEVEANVLGSAVDAAFEIHDAEGRVVAKNDDGAGIDPRLEVAFAKAGTYYVRVHDSKYSAQEANFYRLKAGAYPYAEALFPLGWKRGGEVRVEALGGNLKQAVEVKPSLEEGRRLGLARAPGSQSLPLLFAWSGDEHEMEAAAGGGVLKPDVVMNGRIAKAKEVDRYKLAVKPGEHWVIEVVASRYGTSRLDALVTVRDAAGKKIESRDDLAGADPVAPFEAPEGTGEVTVEIEDVLGRGGAEYGYQVVARRSAADFTLSLAAPYINIPAGGTMQIPVTVQRRGYDGPLRLFVENLPEGLTVAGGHVAAAASQQRFDDPNPRFGAVRSLLTVTAEEGMAPRRFELSVVGVAVTPEGRMERRASWPGLVTAVRGARQKAVTAEWLEMKLPAAVTRPLPVRLTSGTPLLRLSQGNEYAIPYRVERTGGARIEGRVRNVIGSAVGNLRINQGVEDRGPDRGSFLFVTNFATPAEHIDLALEATAVVEGKPVVVYAPVVTAQVVHGFHVELENGALALRPGGQADLRGRIWREWTFEGGAVLIEAQDLPEGVTCDPVEVPAEAKRFRMRCSAGANAEPGEHEIRLTAAAPETGKKAKDTYKIPDVAAHLVVRGAAGSGR